jgi:hypothetical protein
MKVAQPAHSASKWNYWNQIMNDWERSGCRTQAAFCRQAGISIKSFRRWRSVFTREALQGPAGVAFAKVEVQASLPSKTGIRIALSPHAHIDISPDFDEATLRRVLGVCI